MKTILTALAIISAIMGGSCAHADTSSQTQTVTLHFNPLAKFSVGINSQGDLAVNARSRVGKSPTTLMTQVALIHDQGATFSRIASVSTTSLNQNIVHTTNPSQRILMAAFTPRKNDNNLFALTTPQNRGFDYQLTSEKDNSPQTSEAIMVYVLSNP